jgi:hypothetical protein
VPVRRSGLPPPPLPTTLDVAAYWAPSTAFAVLLALAHVIAASKTTTTAKDFSAGDFMCAFSFLCPRRMPVVCLGGCDVDHGKHVSAETNRWSQRKSEVHLVDRTEATKPDQLVVCTEAK